MPELIESQNISDQGSLITSTDAQIDLFFNIHERVNSRKKGDRFIFAMSKKINLSPFQSFKSITANWKTWSVPIYPTVNSWVGYIR